MFFQPVRLGPTALPAETVTADKNACRHFGPCGVGKEALYLNSYFLDASNVAEAIYATHPYGVDSFSLTNYDDDRADTDRCKDPAKVEAFIKAAKDA